MNNKPKTVNDKIVNEVKTQIVSFKTYLFEDNRKCKSEIGDLIKSRFSKLSTQQPQSTSLPRQRQYYSYPDGSSMTHFHSQQNIITSPLPNRIKDNNIKTQPHNSM